MLRRANPTTRELLSDLLTNNRVPAPPSALPLRTAMVRHAVESTYVVPGDWPGKNDGRWFADNRVPADGSDVQYLIDGEKAFGAMREAMETAESSSHALVLLGWSLNVDTPMGGGKSFLKIIEERAQLGVAVRVLLWKNAMWIDNSRGAKKALDGLRARNNTLDVFCNLDDNVRGQLPGLVTSVAGYPDANGLGAHHHKVLLVYGREGLVGFVGGVDIDPNRLRGRGLHDTHVRVQGSAAHELRKIAEQRWQESRDNKVPPSPPSIAGLASALPADPTRNPYLARVVQTVGNPTLTSSIPNTLWPAVKHALRQAKKFIYLEDQYFWSLELVEELVHAAKRVRDITILLPPAHVGEANTIHLRLHAIGELVKHAARDSRGLGRIEEKIGIYEMRRRGHDWVHSKLLVIDDEFAMVGTANANDRGYSFDSEAAAVVTERAATDAAGPRAGRWHVVEANLARRLRIELWAEHLGMDHAELFDGVAACVHWRLLQPGQANVAVFQVPSKSNPREKEPWWKISGDWYKVGDSVRDP